MAHSTYRLLAVCALASGLTIFTHQPSNALTMQECSAKYQAAKTSGALGNQTWNDFRAQQCGDNAAPARPAAQAPTIAPVPARPVQAPAVPAGVNITGPGRQAEVSRQRQCGAEWRANKEALKAQYGSWPKYWSACNTRIKTNGR